MNKIKFHWDVIIVLLIGTSLTLFSLYLTYRDITFLVTKKELTSSIKMYDDQEKRFEVEYQIDNKNYSVSKYKLDKDVYDAIRSDPDMKLYYNQQFPEQVYFDVENSVSWGTTLLMLVGIFVIIFLTRHAATTLSK
jgi:hypothetical protein